jgi:putative membrane protein
MQLITILGIVVAALGVAFALQNNVPVTVTFLIWRFDSTLAMVLLLALGLGAIIVALVLTPTALRKQWLLLRQRKEIASLNATVKELQAGIADRQGGDQAAVRADRTAAQPPA